MILSLAIHSPPSSQASYSAYQFAKVALIQGHSIYRVFFYHNGVYHGSDLTCSGQDEFDLIDAWKQLQNEYQLDLVACIAAGLKRGIIDTTEAERYEKDHHNLGNHFELSGLGQLVDATVTSERLISFGG